MWPPRPRGPTYAAGMRRCNPGWAAVRSARAWRNRRRSLVRNMQGQGSGRPTLLLTGAAEGLGASIAATFAATGYDVVGLARSDRASAHVAPVVGERVRAYVPLGGDSAHPAVVAAALGAPVR